MTSAKIIRTAAVLLTGVWCLSIVLAPVLRTQGLSVSALLYSIFSGVCHQFPDRSFHLAGEPLAVCIRCSAIYFGAWISLVFMSFTVRIHRYPPAWLLAAAISPMAADVILSLTGLHASDTLSRTLSGLLAGVVVPYYVMPPLVESVQQLVARSGGLSHAGKNK
jgi:uncharacterized membrane protein